MYFRDSFITYFQDKSIFFRKVFSLIFTIPIGSMHVLGDFGLHQSCLIDLIAPSNLSDSRFVEWVFLYSELAWSSFVLVRCVSGVISSFILILFYTGESTGSDEISVPWLLYSIFRKCG